MKEKEEKRAVFVRAELYSEMEEREDDTDFGLEDEYVEFVLEEDVMEEEEERAFSEEEAERFRLSGVEPWK